MKKNISGFTLVEILVVVSIIGILSAIGIVSYSQLQVNARNSQRASQVKIISEAIEKYYNKNGAYPTCTDMIAPASTVVSTTLKGLDPINLTAPGAASGTNSIACSSPPDPLKFVYTLLAVQGGPVWSLSYYEEKTNTEKTIASRHTIPVIVRPVSPIASVTYSSWFGGYLAFTWTSISCSGTLSPYYNYIVNDKNISTGIITQIDSKTQIQGGERPILVDSLLAGHTYSLTVYVGCYNTTGSITLVDYLSDPAADPAHNGTTSYTKS